MTEQRKEKLLFDVAKQFADSSTPMNHDWLVENDVTLDECGDLCGILAGIIGGYVKSPKHIKLAVLASYAVDSKLLAETVVRIMEGKTRR